MSRIFMSLSILPVVLIFVTMTLGWWIGDYNGAYQKLLAHQREALEAGSDVDETQLAADVAALAEPQRRFSTHFQFGLATALTTVLINSLSVTYLIGTSRWVKEVTDAYRIDPGLEQRSTTLKRQTFPWSLGGVMAILTIVALGAASDPGTSSATTADWVLPHSLAAMIGACMIVWSIVVQAYNLHRNAAIIDEVVEEVRRERLARGLDVVEEGTY